MPTGTRAKSRRARETRTDRRARRERARGRVIAAGLRLAERRSFQELTIDEIARAGGLSRTAFYTHFPDKHELLVAAVEEVSAELYEMADQWWHGVGLPADRVRRAIEGVVSVYAGQARLLRIATEVSTYDEDLRDIWLGIAERFIEATAEHIRGEQSAGLIPASLDPRATGEALFWMVERCCYTYLGPGERAPDELVRGLAPVWTAPFIPARSPPDGCPRAASAARLTGCLSPVPSNWDSFSPGAGDA